jgi:hypothetical protein
MHPSANRRSGDSDGPLFAALLMLVVVAAGCGTSVTESGGFPGTYVLVSENGESIPTDPDGPGCCVTLGGSITFAASTYDLRGSYRNRSNGLTFENEEQGSWTRDGATIHFTPTAFHEFPFLLDDGTVEGNRVILLYGDEGPGSNQIRGVYERR